MGRVEACRICLITDVNLEKIRGSLETNIKSVFGHNVLFSSDLPDYCCYECTALISKFNKFKKKYFTAQSILFNILQNHGVVTENEIKNIDRVASKLNSNLSSNLIDIEKVEMKEECDPMEDTLEMTVEEEMYDSGSEDDVPLHSVKQIEHINVNERIKKHDPSKRMSHINTENISGESSNNMRKLRRIAHARNESLLNDFDVAKNNTYSQPRAFEISMNNLEPVQQETIQLVEQQAPVQIISSENSDTMISTQTLILNKLNLIIENQKRFGQKLASLSVQLDETNETIRQLQQETQCSVTLLKDAHSEERENFSVKPIESNEEFEMFELTLADKMHRKKLIKCLSPLYSSKPGQGQTCAYRLIDVLFTREFLCQCSWSGGSRGEHSKIPLKKFMNFRKFFFEIIHMWDPSFTDDQMLFFFKIVLKNANKRKSMLGLRESTKRVRKSKNLRRQVGNEVIVPVGNKDDDSNQLEANNSNNTEEPRTDDNNAEKHRDEDDTDEDPRAGDDDGESRETS